jgi:hypothetical protein
MTLTIRKRWVGEPGKPWKLFDSTGKVIAEFSAERNARDYRRRLERQGHKRHTTSPEHGGEAIMPEHGQSTTIQKKIL